MLSPIFLVSDTSVRVQGPGIDYLLSQSCHCPSHFSGGWKCLSARSLPSPQFSPSPGSPLRWTFFAWSKRKERFQMSLGYTHLSRPKSPWLSHLYRPFPFLSRMRTSAGRGELGWEKRCLCTLGTQRRAWGWRLAPSNRIKQGQLILRKNGSMAATHHQFHCRLLRHTRRTMLSEISGGYHSL